MLRSFSIAVLASCAQASSRGCDDAQGFFDAIFSSLGADCETYAELFADGAQYYHQHDGYKASSELKANCEGFGAHFPPGTTAFRQAGDALVGLHDGHDCHFLVPYLWSEVPAGDGQPHTGWEYIIARQDRHSQFGYKMKHFAEIETTFTVPLNWHNPAEETALFEESTLAELHLTTSDTTDACDAPLARTLTHFLQQQEVHQQGDAVVLAAGGLCQVTVPFASEDDGNLMSGYFVLQLQKGSSSYSIRDFTKFDLGHALAFHTTNQRRCGHAQGFFDAIFSSLGADCETYAELFADGAQYYHQHDGYKASSELKANCEGFGAHFPPGTTAFRQAGDALVGLHDGHDCHFLVPYLWSEVPAGDGQPHTGWEYIIARQDRHSQFGYKMKHFAEIETTFTVPLNWHNPAEETALFEESTLAELHLTTSDTTDACDAPLARTLTHFLQQQEVHQQGDAVVLAAGGLCQVTVPFASEDDGNLMSGYFVLQLQKGSSRYSIRDSTKFEFGKPMDADHAVMLPEPVAIV